MQKRLHLSFQQNCLAERLDRLRPLLLERLDRLLPLLPDHNQLTVEKNNIGIYKENIIGEGRKSRPFLAFSEQSVTNMDPSGRSITSKEIKRFCCAAKEYILPDK